jgi:hypothetical protein
MNSSTANQDRSLIALRRKKSAAGKIGAAIRGWQSRHVNPVSVRMNKAVSEIALRGVNPAWIRTSSTQWWAGLKRIRVNYSLERSTYADGTWLVTVFVSHDHTRIMFLAHNTTATGNQELELRLIIYGKRAASLISYSRFHGALNQRKDHQTSDDYDEFSESAIHARGGEFLAGALRLDAARDMRETKKQFKEKNEAMTTNTTTTRMSSASKRDTPSVHLVVKTDISIALIQARYKIRMERRKSVMDTEKKVEEAATAVQSLFRGRTERRAAASKKNETKAATLVQAILRGKVSRATTGNELRAHRQKRNAAATKLQAGVRRRHVARARVQERSAATKLQARFRGSQARKSVVGVRHGMMSETAHDKDWKSGEYARLKDTGLSKAEIHAAIRISNLVQ